MKTNNKRQDEISHQQKTKFLFNCGIGTTVSFIIIMILYFYTTQHTEYLIGCMVSLLIASIILFAVGYRHEIISNKDFNDRIDEINNERCEYLTEKRSKFEGSEQINDKLKPCPICGAKVKLLSFERDSWLGLGCIIGCINEKCSTRGNPKIIYVKELPDIIEKWNSIDSKELLNTTKNEYRFEKTFA